MNGDLGERLSGLRLEMAPETAERHLGAVVAALHQPVPLPPTPRRRRWVLIVVTAAALSLPVAALAAEGALPGEAMYPVKRAFEWVRSVVDRDLGATHRVEELEMLIDRRAPADVIRDRLAVADRAVPDGHVDLRRRLDAARRLLDESPPTAASDRPAETDGEDGRPQRGDDAATTTTPSTSPPATTTTEAPTTTTTPSDGGDRSGDDRDRPPPTSRG